MIEVVCAVIVEEGKCLLCQRAPGKHLGGFWEFPGGKVEDGEEPEEALVREIREELACEVVVGDSLEAVEHHYPGLSIRLRPFLCRVVEGELRAVEHAALAWVGAGDLSSKPLAEADEKVAEHWRSFRGDGSR